MDAEASPTKGVIVEEMGVECAEAYFYYGKALLELSRVESGVLGNALDGVNMDAEASPTKGVIVEDAEGLPTVKKAEIEEKVADALADNFDKHEMLAKAHNADNTEEPDNFDKHEMLAKAHNADNTEETEEDTGEDKMETDVEKTEEPGNLEQAWQMFNLAKVIYGKAKNEVKEC